MLTIEITRKDLSVLQLRAAAARTADAKQTRRMLAIAKGLVGRGRWHGPADAARGPRPGRWPRLAKAQRSEVAKWVEDGPDLKTDGVVRWRYADLRDRIAAKFNVHLHERSVGKLLKKLNFSSMSGRPVHTQSDLAAQEAFKQTSLSWRAPQSRRSLPAGRSKSGFRMKPALASKAR